MNMNYRPKKVWTELGDGFSDPVKAASFPKKILRLRNQKAAETVGLDELTDSQWLQYFGDFTPLPNSLEQPLALRYHGHQFTHYNPQLGDGRGFLFAQLMEKNSSRILDLGTKGSGQTPYSRQGDGKLTLKGAVREALATAYLEYQDVNTSKTFSIIETGEELTRNDEPSPTRSAVLTRLSHSHIRIGTFQRLAFYKESKKVKRLMEYCCHHYYPETELNDLFQAICIATAKTTAQWMIHGFVHGVLNTDNINITGESFDYGPYRFLPYYDLNFTAAYFDHQGLYAYGRQPQMMLWNLEQLQEALSSCIRDKTYFEKGYKAFKTQFELSTLELFCQKLGICPPKNSSIVKNLFYLCLQFLEKSKAPYEQFFHDLYCWHQDLNQPLRQFNRDLYDNDSIEEIEKLLAGFERSPLAPNKRQQDCQTLLIDEVESLWQHIDTQDDWSPLITKLGKLNN